MSNNRILTIEEVDVRHMQRRAAEEFGGASKDDKNTQEEWRSYVRKQVNRMVDLDTGAMKSPDARFDMYIGWSKVAQIALDAMASINRQIGVEREFQVANERLRPCNAAPPGWKCKREGGHDGPCAAYPVGSVDAFDGTRTFDSSGKGEDRG